MNDDLFFHLSESFPGQNHIKTWRYCFYFENKDSFDALLSTSALMGLAIFNSGDIGITSKYRYYIFYERNPYAHSNKI